MKKIYLLTLTFLATSLSSTAQTPCDAGRYSTDLFPTTTVTSNIDFGQNTTFTGATQNLKLDIYEPAGDTETARPLIIWAHGGSFIGGTKTDGDVVALSQAFAKKGYVCSSIDYRTGMWPIDSVNAIKAVLRAVQDMKAAVRFFRQDKATTNTYKIDTNRIYIGGSSAGAVTSLHLAYLDQECEITKYIDLATLNSLGGIEGASGNPGYMSNVHAVVNLCGALASYGWIAPGDAPLCSMHGNNDGTVPYNRAIANVSGFPIMYLDGSRMLKEQADAIGLDNKFYTHYNGGHAVYAGSAPYMDTTIKFVRDFLIDQLACTDPALQPENAPTGVANLYALDYCGLGLDEESIANTIETIYPNPSRDEMHIVFNNGEVLRTIELADLAGRIVFSFQSNSAKVTLKKDNLLSGSYIVRISDNNGYSTTKNVVFQ